MRIKLYKISMLNYFRFEQRSNLEVGCSKRNGGPLPTTLLPG